jgi:hypothetical protein
MDGGSQDPQSSAACHAFQSAIAELLLTAEGAMLLPHTERTARGTVNAVAVLATLLAQTEPPAAIAAVVALDQGRQASLLRALLASELRRAESGGADPVLASLSGWRLACISALVERLLSAAEAIPAPCTEGGSAGITIEAAAALALAQAAQAVPDELQCVSPHLPMLRGCGATANAAALLPLFGLLHAVLPWYVNRPDSRTTLAPSVEQKQARWHELMDPAWVAFDEVKKKSFRFIVVSVQLFLHHGLWSAATSEGWHGHGGGALHSMYTRLAAMTGPNRSVRLQLAIAHHCARLWAAYPHTLAAYADELGALATSINAHDDSTRMRQRNSTTLHLPPPTGWRGGGGGGGADNGEAAVAPQLAASTLALPTEVPSDEADEAARRAIRLLFEGLLQQAQPQPQPAPTATTPEAAAAVAKPPAREDGAALGALESVLRSLLHTSVHPPQCYACRRYAVGSDTFKFRLLLWHTIGVLVRSPRLVRRGTALAREVSAALEHAVVLQPGNSPSVRERIDAVAVLLLSRCPELLHDQEEGAAEAAAEPSPPPPPPSSSSSGGSAIGWLGTALRRFDTPPQTAMSLCVIAASLPSRLAAARLAWREVLPVVQPPLTGWAMAANRPLRALAQVLASRLTQFVAAQLQLSAGNGGEGAGWPPAEKSAQPGGPSGDSGCSPGATATAAAAAVSLYSGGVARFVRSSPVRMAFRLRYGSSGVVGGAPVF